ncbi:MAG: biotin/lipoyl-binding protein [Clostridia bacterium]
MQKTKASLGVIAATAITVLTLFLLPFTPKVAVRTVLPTRGDLIETIFLEGVICYQNEQPCVNLQAGLVKAVYANHGQRVKAGELLFCLDTTAEEQALGVLTKMNYEREQAIQSMGEHAALEALSLQSTMDAKKMQAELQMQIESKQIRAQSDGVVGGVFTEKGAYVAAMSVLGTVRDERKCVTTVNHMQNGGNVAPNTAAELQSATGKKLGFATLKRIGAPTIDAQTAQYLQQLTFMPSDENALDAMEIGDRVTVELLCNVSPNEVLVPLSAIGSGDKLWVVKDGAATPLRVDLNKRNEEYVCVSETLLGKRVILMPDESELYAGCAVKEAKKR